MSSDLKKARWNDLLEVVKDQDLDADFKSDVIDFQEMNCAFIQAVSKGSPNGTGSLFLEVSNIRLDDVRNPDGFVPYPNSERDLNDSCNNFGWEFCCIPFRYARICYNVGTNTQGTVSINVRAKRT